MDMETVRFVVEIVVAVLLTPLAVVLWFMLRKMMAEIDELQKGSDKAVTEVKKELYEYKLYVANKYPTQDNMESLRTSVNELKDAVFSKLDRMGEDIRHMSDNFRDRLDLKQDKQH